MMAQYTEEDTAGGGGGGGGTMSPATTTTVTTTWERLSGPADFGLVGFTLVHQAAVLAVVVHLIRHRNWPPYVTKHVVLVATTGVGSSFSLLGGLISSGIVFRREGDLLASCCAEAALQSLGTALHFFPAFVRVYRNYMLLILHKAAMWSVMAQLQVVLWPYMIPVFIYLAKPYMWEFEEYRNQCFGNPWIGIASFLYMAVGISTAFVLVVRMRRVRTQLNEFRVMLFPLAFLTVWALYLVPAGLWFGKDYPNVARRLVMIDNFVSTVVLFWCPIVVPLMKHLQKNEQYVWQFTFGFSQLPTPGQMRASLADQLEVEDLRIHFRKYAAGRAAPELPDFYKACIDREEVEDYFERQAATMAIIDRFVVEGAEQEINISEECRQRVLDSEITRYNIFDEAIAEVLHVMEANFKADFERTMEFRELSQAVEREARELQVLRQARLAPEPLDNTRLSFSRLSRRFALPRVGTNEAASPPVRDPDAAVQAGFAGRTSEQRHSNTSPRTSPSSATADPPLPPAPITSKGCSISSDVREEANDRDGDTSVVAAALSAIPRETTHSPGDDDGDGDGDDNVSPRPQRQRPRSRPNVGDGARGRDSSATTDSTVAVTTAATQYPGAPPSSTSGALRRPLSAHGRMLRGISKLARGLASVSAALARERRVNAGGDSGESEGSSGSGGSDGLTSSASNPASSTSRSGKVFVEVMRELYATALAAEPEHPADLEDAGERKGAHHRGGDEDVDK